MSRDGAPGAGRPSGAGTGGAELAAVVQRVAVLLGAGASPATAWRHAGSGTGLAGWAAAVAAAEPADVAERIAAGGGAQRAGLAAAWAVAVESGAPLAAALRSFAGLLRGFAEADRQARVALSGPIATARLVLAMPAVGILLGAVLGQDSLRVLLGSPIGWGCLGVGGGLMLAAWRWNRALLRRAAAGDRLPGLVAELVATAMSGGAAEPRARSLVASALRRFGLPADFAVVESAIRAASAAGAPVAELLRAEAEEARRDALATAAARAERLSVVLMLPLGLCVLPAFLALGVVPVIVGIVASTVAGI